MEPRSPQQKSWEVDVETVAAVLFVLAFLLPPAALAGSVIALVLGSRRRDVARAGVPARNATAH